MKYSIDKKVAFNPKNHTYFIGDKKLTSVTSFISKFKNEFDSDYHSKRIAEREGVSQQSILDLWKYKANKSCEIGTAIHKIFEDYTEGKYKSDTSGLCFDCLPLPDDFLTEFSSKKDGCIKFITDFFIANRLTPIHTEYIVYNDFLAGQVDMICRDSKGDYHIIDFKTNKSIDESSYGKKMKGLLSNYNDSNFYHYSLQLSIYKKLIKEYKISSIYIIHIQESCYKLLKCIDILDSVNLLELAS